MVLITKETYGGIYKANCIFYLKLNPTKLVTWLLIIKNPIQNNLLTRRKSYKNGPCCDKPVRGSLSLP